MSRSFVSDIAKEVGLHPQTIRNLVDRGIIKSASRDYNQWRWFPEPLRTIKEIQQLLNGETVPKKKEPANADNTPQVGIKA